MGDLNEMLAQFIRAQLTLAGLSLLSYSAFLGIMQVPYWLVLGTAGGLMEFVPVVGPMVASIMIMGAVLIAGYQHWLAVLIFLGLWRITQDYLVSRESWERVQNYIFTAIFGVLAGARLPAFWEFIFRFRSWRACVLCGGAGGCTRRSADLGRSRNCPTARRSVRKVRSAIENFPGNILASVTQFPYNIYWPVQIHLNSRIRGSCR